MEPRPAKAVREIRELFQHCSKKILGICGSKCGRNLDKISEAGLTNSASQLAQDGDVILVTRISPGKVGIARNKIAINQDLKIVKHWGGMLPSFSYYLFSAIEKKIILK